MNDSCINVSKLFINIFVKKYSHVNYHIRGLLLTMYVVTCLNCCSALNFEVYIEMSSLLNFLNCCSKCNNLCQNGFTNILWV